ncbi:phosphoglycerate mutase family protein [Bacillus sp. FJAT-42376]|uniref:histidine phosphatase family protein n=1 Tax=Bacillus sp. FJAT-42376 TaxID=2014076 RepID=UPI0013DDE053|nr:phosphoglycerate mutase family protein [Bacillus sp. FJAT-42376]
MKITIVRHYRVDCPYKKMMTPEEFRSWCVQYDTSSISKILQAAEDSDWDACYSSDLVRASQTAEHLYGVPVITPLLREIPIAPFTDIKGKLPFHVWMMMGRLSWLFSLPSQSETRKQTAERANQWISEAEVLGFRHILAVSHGFYIRVLTGQLVKRGYKGRKAGRAKNGEQLVFEKA